MWGAKAHLEHRLQGAGVAVAQFAQLLLELLLQPLPVRVMLLHHT